MNLHLTDKIIVVGGASKGIGLACAEALAAEGVNLHLAARSADLLADHAARIAGEHGKITGFRSVLGRGRYVCANAWRIRLRHRVRRRTKIPRDAFVPGSTNFDQPDPV